MNNRRFIARQGDLIIIAVASGTVIPTVPAPTDPRGLVLAEGETSGHHHALFGEGARLALVRYNLGHMLLDIGVDGAFVRVIGGESRKSTGALVPRHIDVPLEHGRYTAYVQRTWDSSRASRDVTD